MGKPPDKHDATLPLTESQVVAVTPKPPDHAIPKNDRSVWKGMVVGADEFAPMPTKPARSRKWLLIGVLGVVAGGAGIAGYELYSGGGNAGGSGSASGSGSGSGSGSVAPAAVPVPPPMPDAAPPSPPPVDAPPPPADAPVDAPPPPAKPATPAKKKRIQKIRKAH